MSIMHKRNRSRAAVLALICAAGSAAPLAWGTTFTWIGASGTWGDTAQWKGTATLPPNGSSAECFLGNNGTVALAGGTFTAAALHVGHIGANNPGTSQLLIDSGTLTLAQNITVGEGNAGSIIINGGALVTSSSKNVWLGGGTLKLHWLPRDRQRHASAQQ